MRLLFCIDVHGGEGINGSELRQATLTSGRLRRPSTTFAQPPVNKITHGIDDETDDSSRREFNDPLPNMWDSNTALEDFVKLAFV